MLVLWMGYAVVVGLVVVATAALLEGGIRSRRRWLWAGAQLLAASLPLVRPVLRRLGASQGTLDVAFGPIAPAVRDALPSLNELGTAASHSITLQEVQGPLAGAWVGASLVLGIILLAGILRVRRLRRNWTAERVDGTDVLVSESLGPAVVGVRRPVIVVPSWVLGLDEAERTLILAHEDEHRRSGDPALLAAALALPVLMPWNPAAWIAFARLREAVETDCDARVLARGGRKPLHYARLLFDVSTRTADAVPVGAGFGERASSLERRIRTMLAKRLAFGWKGLSARAGLATVLVMAACSLEVNIAVPDKNEAVDAGAATDAPTVDIPAPTDPRVGTEPIQRPATPVVETSEAARIEMAEARRRRDKQLSQAPTFTPFTVAPTIRNRAEVIQAMEAEYPPLLRDAGIGGTVKVYFFINEEGVATDVRIDESSGHQALDDAALRVAGKYRFSPALNRAEKVPVWVSFPITFQVR